MAHKNHIIKYAKFRNTNNQVALESICWCAGEVYPHPKPSFFSKVSSTQPDRRVTSVLLLCMYFNSFQISHKLQIIYSYHPKQTNKHSRLGAKGPPLVGEEVRKRVGT
jgi:hypothetical protein